MFTPQGMRIAGRQGLRHPAPGRKRVQCFGQALAKQFIWTSSGYPFMLAEFTGRLTDMGC